LQAIFEVENEKLIHERVAAYVAIASLKLNYSREIRGSRIQWGNKNQTSLSITPNYQKGVNDQLRHAIEELVLELEDNGEEWKEEARFYLEHYIRLGFRQETERELQLLH